MRLDKNQVMIFLAEKEMSVADLADKMGFSRQGMADALRRESCRPATLGRMAKALEVQVSEIAADGR